MIAGLVLAAGAGVRFGPGESKLLADLEGRPLIEWAVSAQCAVPELEDVVVVLGAQASLVASGASLGRARVVVCHDWESGQAASLRCGLEALAGAEKVIVTLGDAPLITPAVISLFVGEPGGTRAVYGGRPGHPAVLGGAEIDAVRGLGGDRGARDLLAGGRVIEVGHLCSGRDVDTPEDLEAIRMELEQPATPPTRTEAAVVVQSVAAETEPAQGLSLVGAQLWGQARRNALQLVALVVGFLLALRVFRRRG